MCGIFGWHLREGHLSNTKRKMLYDLLAAQNDDRGGHSWGVCVVDQKTKVPSIEKGLGDLFDARFETALPWKSDIMFAHTRFATHGEKTVENAHPFRVGKLIGAHNGVLSNHGWLNTEYGRDFKVDSQHIFAQIDEKEDIRKLAGYGAIEYLDVDKPQTVYVGTFNHYLSVWRLKAEDKAEQSDGVIWTSDSKHGAFAMQMLRTYHEQVKIPDDKLFEVYDSEIFKTEVRLNIPRGQTFNWREENKMDNGIRSHNYQNGSRETTVYPYGYSGGNYHSILCSATRCTNKRADNSTLCKECLDKTVPPHKSEDSPNIVVVKGLLPAASNETSGEGSSAPIPFNRGEVSKQDWDAFTASYCSNCYEKNEDCHCHKKKDGITEMVVDCDLCSGEGFADTGSDFVRCTKCHGQGALIIQVEQDSSFDVTDGFNDRLLR